MAQEKTYFATLTESLVNPSAETNEDLTIFPHKHLKFIAITNWKCSMWILAIYIVNCSKNAVSN